jgi:hypothetical protein
MKKSDCSPLPLAPELRQAIGHVSFLVVHVVQGQIAKIAILLETGAAALHANAMAEVNHGRKKAIQHESIDPFNETQSVDRSKEK